MFAMILCVVIGFGFLVATIVGVAYGYNYSVAEYVQVHKKDVTVYMRRGSFEDSPDFLTVLGGQGPPKMLREDNKAEGSDAKPLSENWEQSKDNQNYADKINTFDSGRRNLALLSSVETTVATASSPLVYPHIQRVTKILDVVISTSETPLENTAMIRKLKPYYPSTTKSDHPGTNEEFYKSDDPDKAADGKGVVQNIKLVPKQEGPLPRLKDADYIYEENFTYKPVK